MGEKHYERPFAGEKGEENVLWEIIKVRQEIESDLEKIAIRVGRESMGPSTGYISDTVHYICGRATPLISITLHASVYSEKNHGAVSLRIKYFDHGEQIPPIVKLAEKYKLELKKMTEYK